MEGKKRIGTTPGLVLMLVYVLSWEIMGGAAMTVQEAEQLKNKLERMKAKVDGVSLKLARISGNLNNMAGTGFPQYMDVPNPCPTSSNIPTPGNAVAVWPLNAKYGASDATGKGNDGTAVGTQLAPGPYGNAGGAFLFAGSSESYVEIPNHGPLDVQFAYTILAHIYPTGSDGPIFDYEGVQEVAWGFAVHLWQKEGVAIFMRPVGRSGQFPRHSWAKRIEPNAWNYVGGTYDTQTGRGSVWHNGERLDDIYYGVWNLATNYPVRIGSKKWDNRRYAGRVACVQLYDYAMTAEQIAAARDVCRGDGEGGPFANQVYRIERERL
ncbi:hypothetical protein Bbelb_323610 [Branchiostoma belcheri]|nr:hypothetical protein Bbelb_323610 [Branchiostoma belcheri]